MSRTRVLKRVVLDTNLKSPEVAAFEQAISERVIGQDRALRAMISCYQILQAGMANPDRPIATMLFLGPTGCGKTRIVEAAAEALFQDSRVVIKIDCAEFQHSHEIAKLIGSPPGYLGHRETPPLFSQQNLNKSQTPEHPFSLILFDEIEKASDALWHLLLGILDKATLTLGDNTRVDFSQTIIFMTSNLGAKEMSRLVSDGIGFRGTAAAQRPAQEIDQDIYRAALAAARRKFTPEFMNRIDKVVVFRSLRDDQFRQILEVELGAVQRRIDSSKLSHFDFTLSPQAKQFLLARGIDYQYGARHLKRAIERYLVNPLSRLIATGQVRSNDKIFIDVDDAQENLFMARELPESDGHISKNSAGDQAQAAA